MTPDKSESPLAKLLKAMNSHWTLEAEHAWHEYFQPVGDRRKRRMAKEAKRVAAQKWPNWTPGSDQFLQERYKMKYTTEDVLRIFDAMVLDAMLKFDDLSKIGIYDTDTIDICRSILNSRVNDSKMLIMLANNVFNEFNQPFT